MRAPAFWSISPPTLAARLLSPLGMVYGAATVARMRKPGVRAALPVLCIGNVTAGGAGKTPVAIALAKALRAQGFSPVFLSRGYGGSASGPLLVDSARHRAAEVGDEPLLLARTAPAVIAADRVAGAALAASEGDVLIMDDGLQNPSLAKDFTLCVVDGGTGLGNGLVLPAGPLRAPAAAQAAFIDAVLVLGEGARAADAQSLGRPLHRSTLTVDAATATRLNGQRVLAYAGIGRPQKFFDTLTALGAHVEAARAFADHHPFTPGDAQALLAEAAQHGLQLVTTEKDVARLSALPALADASLAVPVSLALPPALVDEMVAAISARR